MRQVETAKRNTYKELKSRLALLRSVSLAEGRLLWCRVRHRFIGAVIRISMQTRP